MNDNSFLGVPDAVAVTAPAPGNAKWQETAADLAAGTTAGLVGKAFEYPFDTIKVRQQTQPGLGLVECVTRSVRNDGVLSLYRGLSAPIFGAMAENAIIFGLYASVRRSLAGSARQADLDASPTWHAMAAGAVAGFGVAFWVTPVELVKVRMQAEQTAHLYTGSVHCVRELFREHGLGIFFRGHSATLIRETVGGAFYFGAYAAACRLLTPEGKVKSDMSSFATMMAGGCGGAAYWASTFPADTIKSRMQSGQLPEGVSFLRAFNTVRRAEGFASLYRGLGVTVARAFPANSLIFLTYERVFKFITEKML